MPAALLQNSESTYYAADQIVAGQTITANGDSGAKSAYGALRTLKLVTAVSGASGTTPTLDLYIDESPDGGTTWVLGETHATQITTNGNASTVITLPVCKTIRLRWVVGGTTPSFTLSAWLVSATW